MTDVPSSAASSMSSLSTQEQLQAFRLLMENVTDYAVFLFDPERKIVFWNKGAELLEGYREDEILGRSADIIFTPEDRDRQAPEHEMQTARTEGRAEDERWHLRKDGSRFWGSGVVTALRDEQGELRWYIKIMRDLTERHDAEARLAAASARTQDILESIRDAFYAVDKQWRLTYVNRQAERLWKRSRAELLGTVLWEMFPGYESTPGYQMHQRAMQEQQPVHFESFSANLQCWIDVGIYPSASGLSVYFRDITARKEAEARMHALVEETAVLQERTRMAQELHDTLAQAFTAIMLQMQAAEDALPTGSDQAQGYLTRARQLAQEGLQEARRAVRALRTPALEGGLVSALQTLVERTTSGTGIKAAWEVEGAVYSLPETIESELYRIAQEGLTNALRHAHARQITITLLYAPSTVKLGIDDDGRGFDPTTRAAGFGLQGMRERAGRIGAEFSLSSESGKGTHLVITLPTTAFPKRTA